MAVLASRGFTALLSGLVSCLGLIFDLDFWLAIDWLRVLRNHSERVLLSGPIGLSLNAFTQTSITAVHGGCQAIASLLLRDVSVAVLLLQHVYSDLILFWQNL